MHNNLCIIRGGNSYCTYKSGEWQITPAVLRMNIHKNPATLRVTLGFPHLLVDSPRCSQTFHNRSHGASVSVIRDSSYSEGQTVFPPRLWYYPEIVASKFTLHILLETPGGSQQLKSILLMYLDELMDSAPGAWTLFIRMSNRNHGNVAMWLYLWALIES
jgi:hypothetical protein